MRSLFRVLPLLLIAKILLASPPLDLSDPNALKNYKEKAPAKVLPKVPDLNYTDDHSTFEVKIPEDALTIQYEVPARSLPNREARVLFNLGTGDAVKILKKSRSQLWIQIQTFERKPLRGWVPAAAVKEPAKAEEGEKKDGGTKKTEEKSDFFD